MKFTGTLLGAILGVVIGAAIEEELGAIIGIFFGSLGGFCLGLAINRKFAQARKELLDELGKIEAAFGSQHARILALEKQLAEGGVAPLASAPPPAAAIETIPEPAPAEAPAATPLPRTAATTDEEMLRATARKAAAAERAAKDAAAFDPARIWRWLFGDNAIVRIGAIVLFFAVAFLIKYATDRVTISIEFRLAGVALFAIVMLGLGWRLRTRKAGYALVLQGIGVGILYLTIFGAFRIWGLLPGGLTMVLLIAIVAFSAMLAILQNAPSLAVAGTIGGFLAPILASTGGGSHVMLFSYYIVLNLGVLAIAWFKAWRLLNLVGFFFTFGIGAAWGAKFYVPEHYASVQPFLIVFFLMYVAISTLFATRRAVELKDYVDSTLVFGTPLAAFGLQYAIVRDFEYGAAWSAVGAGVFYLLFAALLLRLQRPSLRLLIETFIAIGIGFATFAIPLAVDDRMTAAVWALEGLGAIWMGVRQQRRLSRFFGVLLQFGAGFFFLSADSIDPTVAVLNSSYLGALMVGVAGVYAGRLLQRGRDDSGIETVAALVLLIWGTLWVLAAGAMEAAYWLSDHKAANAMIAYAAAAFGLLGWLAQRWQWIAARRVPFALLPLLLIFAVLIFFFEDYASRHYGWLAWPVALVSVYELLRRNESALSAFLVKAYHCLALWLSVFLLAWEFGGRIEDWVGGGSVWGLIAWPVVPALAVLFVSRRGTGAWPFSTHLRTYLLQGCGALLVFIYCWIWLANGASNGDPRPLPYLPLANPLDLAVMFTGLVGLYWWRALRAFTPANAADVARFAKPLIAAAMFFWANAVLLRTLHHYADVPFYLHDMLRSTLVQTSFSIFWTLLAFGAMLWAHRHVQRALWVAGAALLAVVVLKLFFIDLSSIEGVQRIVSFLGVGILMLVIGYFVPVPPSRKERA